MDGYAPSIHKKHDNSKTYAFSRVQHYYKMGFCEALGKAAGGGQAGSPPLIKWLGCWPGIRLG